MKRALRNWLIEVMGFVPKSDYDARLVTISHLARYAASMERQNKLLMQENDDLLWRVESTSF